VIVTSFTLSVTKVSHEEFYKYAFVSEIIRLDYRLSVFALPLRAEKGLAEQSAC
jgi:hypothetical protein